MQWCWLKRVARKCCTKTCYDKNKSRITIITSIRTPYIVDHTRSSCHRLFFEITTTTVVPIQLNNMSQSGSGSCSQWLVATAATRLVIPCAAAARINGSASLDGWIVLTVQQWSCFEKGGWNCQPSDPTGMSFFPCLLGYIPPTFCQVSTEKCHLSHFLQATWQNHTKTHLRLVCRFSSHN